MALGDQIKSRVKSGAEDVISKSEKARAAIEMARRASTAAKASQGTFSFFISTITNPVVWVVLLVISGLITTSMFFISLNQTYGRNENADGCFGIGPSSGGATANSPTTVQETPDMWANANAIATWMITTNFDFLGGKPMTLNQAAGVIGNWGQESGYMSSAIQRIGSSPETSAETIRSLGDAGGTGVGLAQWDRGRRVALLDFAQKNGRQWHDMGLQLDYFKYELDQTSEGAFLLAKGFNNPANDAVQNMIAFELGFERAGKPMYGSREQFTKDFLAQWNGGYGGGQTGGSCVMGSSVNALDTSEAVQLAVSMSWPTVPQSRVSAGDVNGVSVAKPEYLQGKMEAQKVGGADPMPDLYASCDRFVATVVKLTMDPDIPWGATLHQQQYLANSPKWQRYEKKSEAKPGDIWITKISGHVLMYVGEVDGKDSIAHASYHDRTAAIDTAGYLNDNLVDLGGRAYYGYRFIGDGSGAAAKDAVERAG